MAASVAWAPVTFIALAPTSAKFLLTQTASQPENGKRVRP